MKLTVYVDVLIVVNTIINYFLLKITAFRLKQSPDSRFFILSAFVGSLFSFTIFFEITQFIALIIKIASLSVCTYISFGFSNMKKYIRCFIYYFSSNAFFYGIISRGMDTVPTIYSKNMFYYIYINPYKLVICVSGVYLAIIFFDMLYDNKHKSDVYKTEIILENNNIILNGFYDTGFNIKDIITSKQIMLCSYADIKQQLSRELRSKIEAFFNNKYSVKHGVIPIFYSDISNNGILPSVKRKKTVINNKEFKNILIAFTDKKLSEDVQIIFGKDIYKELGE